MYQEFENALIATLNDNDIEAVRYEGDFHQPKTLKNRLRKFPTVLVDFVSESESSLGVRTEWNLYILTHQLSSSVKNQENSRVQLYDLMSRMRELLYGATIASGIITFGNLDKLDDSRSEEGYIWIGRRAIHVDFESEITGD